MRPAPEIRPANAPANEYVPTAEELGAFRSARLDSGQTTVESNPLYRYVDGWDGLTRPTTDELIQWVAHKWGIPEDWLRAALANESWWRMSTLSDRSRVSSSWYAQYPPAAQIPGGAEVYESMGIAQVKWLPDGSVGAGTEPLRWKSTAFDLDYWAASIRYYFDGYCHWCGSGYSAGQEWNSIAAWFNPYPWLNSDMREYEATVQQLLAVRRWAQPGF